MTLRKQQFIAAENAWPEYDIGEEVMVEDSEKFETDGEDRLLCLFYYRDFADHPDDDSRKGTFCVNFEPNSAKIKESYVNWH